MLKAVSKMMIVVSLALAAACGGGGGDKDKGDDCIDAFICAGDCDSDSCVQGCIDGASAEARTQMVALGNCAAKNHCDTAADTETCLQTKCGAQLDACVMM